MEAVEVGHLCGAIQADVAHDDVVSGYKGGALGWVHCYDATREALTNVVWDHKCTMGSAAALHFYITRVHSSCVDI